MFRFHGDRFSTIGDEMTTFAEFITRRVEDIDNRNSRTEPKLKEYTIHALHRCDMLDFLPTESTFAFSTIANQETYDGSVVGFPADYKDIHYIQVDLSDQAGGYEIHEKAFSQLRRLFFSVSTSVPLIYAWVGRVMYLGPKPSGIRSISGKYLKSARRDESSGNLITESSGTQTNPWFSEGEAYLQSLVLERYYGSIGNDREQSFYWREVAEVERARINEEWVMHNPEVLPARADNYNDYHHVNEFDARRGFS